LVPGSALPLPESCGAVDSEIVPSGDRLKEFVQAAYLKGELDAAIRKIISCIAEILRLEEERCGNSDEQLRDILVILESGRRGAELKEAFGTAG
jgi:hypothetical protein